MTIASAGPVSRDGIIEIIRAHYPGFRGHAILWDFSRGDVSQLTKEDLELIAVTARSALPTGITRKTAYVVSDMRAFAMACKYLNEAVSARVPAEYAVFTSEPNARKWLTG